MKKWIWLGALTFAACAREPISVPKTTSTALMGVPIEIDVRSLPLNPADPTQTDIGAFTYAGGIEIHGVGSSRVHGLSDLVVRSDGHLIAVTDEGEFFEARLVIDSAGRLSGLSDSRVRPLADQNGRPLQDKFQADAEGLALLPNGDLLVSFERDHRIWRYPTGNGPPRPAPNPNAVFPENGGMEALTAYPLAGPGAYLVGGEGGQVWLCELLDGCRETALGTRVKPGFGLSAITAYGSEGALALLSRAYDPSRGVRVAVTLVTKSALESTSGNVLDELTLAPPLTIDNFEGIAVVPGPKGTLRLYLLSDDNFSGAQHTYLLAFDWKPTK